MGTYEELIEKYRYGADIIFSKPNIAYAEGKTVEGGLLIAGFIIESLKMY